MGNLYKADCGFDPAAGSKKFFEEKNKFNFVDASVLKAATGWDVSENYNYYVDLSAETSNLTIASIKNMEKGKTYKLIASNDHAKQLAVVFPSIALYDGNITPADGMTIVYTFFTDGTNIFCHRSIFS